METKKINKDTPEIMDLGIKIGKVKITGFDGNIPTLIFNCKSKKHLSGLIHIMSNLFVFNDKNYETNFKVGIISNKIIIKATQNPMQRYKTVIDGDFEKVVTADRKDIERFEKEFKHLKVFTISYAVDDIPLPQLTMLFKNSITLHNKEIH